MRNCDGCGGAVGCERGVLGQLLDNVVVNGCGAGFAREQDVDGLLTVEDAAGAAELSEIFGYEGDQSGTVALAVGVEETLFERVKMILKFRVCHAMRSNLIYERLGRGFQLRRAPWKDFIEL
jgi:hypothetical protein